jgi:hypothetical protein
LGRSARQKATHWAPHTWPLLCPTGWAQLAANHVDIPGDAVAGKIFWPTASHGALANPAWGLRTAPGMRRCGRRFMANRFYRSGARRTIWRGTRVTLAASPNDEPRSINVSPARMLNSPDRSASQPLGPPGPAERLGMSDFRATKAPSRRRVVHNMSDWSKF